MPSDERGFSDDVREKIRKAVRAKLQEEYFGADPAPLPDTIDCHGKPDDTLATIVPKNANPAEAIETGQWLTGKTWEAEP